MLPELGRADPEVRMSVGLVPKDTVLQLGALASIVNDKALVILRTLVHDLAEELEGGEGGGIVVENALSVVQVGLAQNEHEVHVRTEGRLNTERVLHSNQEEGLQPTTVHEKIANVLVVGPTVIVHTVVQNHKRPGIYSGLHLHLLILLDLRHNEFLAFDEIRQNDRAELAVNEKGRNHFSVEGVGLFCPADDGSERHVLVIEEEIANEGGFASAAASNEDHYGVLGNTLHVKPFDVEVYVGAGRHFSRL